MEIVGNDGYTLGLGRCGYGRIADIARQVQVETLPKSYSCHDMVGFGNIYNNVAKVLKKINKAL
jgi:hypothetical protein